MNNIFNLNRILFLKSFFVCALDVRVLNYLLYFSKTIRTIGSLLRMFMTIYVRRRKDVE